MKKHGATVITTSDIPLWKFPRFYKISTEAVTEIHERIDFMSMRIWYDCLMGTLTLRYLRAEIAWKNEIFAVLISPEEDSDDVLEDLAVVQNYLSKGKEIVTCYSLHELVEHLKTIILQKKNRLELHHKEESKKIKELARL